MDIKSIRLNNFRGYHAPIKTLFLQGKFGDKVTRGFYGEHITLRNVSLEHLKPHAKGGRNNWANLVLTAKWKNRRRATKPLKEVMNPQKAIEYLDQFKDIHIPGTFDGKDYIRMIKKTLRDMKIFLDSLNVERRVKEKPHTTSRKGFFR